jgi:hypothetical protein
MDTIRKQKFLNQSAFIWRIFIGLYSEFYESNILLLAE